ncbi:MAG: aspartyl/glutamyl-tRNA amidotransferase subunit A [Chloroflexi bacterium GWB2_49_20]|nr:MAG: aspartyl/glutamyl-tRNA amidotransferase subunit A [Chloroflexi bacterium GWB2_49_20]OGN78201.1 MAG: aspartyl/glutamyl-tRNA amidotransferase subunit A [Chloroflexi bacterium GWC2_49_37]OGN85237.1 MAG: aspartyl/glutamyl-tRNA amidotransferase subunit A [Chloroflexi bacterium GWD2_49_16]
MELYNLSIRKAHELLVKKQISSVELTSAVLANIHRLDPKIRAYLTVVEQRALEQARKADIRLHSRENITPLTGIPYAVKDCFSTRGIRTTCGSKILQDYIPQYSASVVEKLNNAGAVLLGKHNMDEFGMGSSCENSAFFNTHNPWNLERVPGGSSGGSAASVSAGLSLFAIGEDTGGSIRMPAGFCNIVGLKPTYGRVSRYGHIALVSSFDSVGPLTQDVYDCATVLQTIAGKDPKDGTSLPDPVPIYTTSLEKSINGLRLGIPREYFQAGMEAGVETVLQDAIRVFEKLGMQVQEVSLPHTRAALPVYYLILFAEASANLARFDGTRFGYSTNQKVESVIDLILQTRQEGFGEEVKRRIMLGAYTLSAGYYDAYYLKAQKVRSLIREDFRSAFEKCDVLLAPTCPTTAFKIGEKKQDPLTMYLSDIFVVATNLAGVPALSLPCGFSEGLPVGMQLIGNHLSEEILFQIGYAYQAETEWHNMHPLIT